MAATYPSTGVVHWRTPENNTGSTVVIGSAGWFEFTTPILPIVPITGSMVLASNWLDEESGTLPFNSQVNGMAKGPGSNVVRVEITDKLGNFVLPDGLKVGKWENAFDLAGGAATVKGVDPANGFDIIDLDPDRFNVWVYDKAKWDAKTPDINVKISTSNVVGFDGPRPGGYDDAATEVNLIRYVGVSRGAGPAGQGWFWSDSQLLVSNAIDNTAAVPGVGADEASSKAAALGPLKHGYHWRASDRTHIVALRGTVKAEYTPDAGPTVSNTKAVPLKHAVGAHVTILNARGANGLESNKGVVTIQQADEDFRRANEQYAQVGIFLIPDYDADVAWPIVFNPSGRVDLADGLNGFDSLDPMTGKVVLTSEEKALLNRAFISPSLGELEVYYINYFDRSLGQTPRRGEAIAASWSPSAGYADSVIISADDRPQGQRI